MLILRLATSELTVVEKKGFVSRYKPMPYEKVIGVTLAWVQIFEVKNCPRTWNPPLMCSVCVGTRNTGQCGTHWFWTFPSSGHLVGWEHYTTCFQNLKQYFWCFVLTHMSLVLIKAWSLASQMGNVKFLKRKIGPRPWENANREHLSCIWTEIWEAPRLAQVALCVSPWLLSLEAATRQASGNQLQNTHCSRSKSCRERWMKTVNDGSSSQVPHL